MAVSLGMRISGLLFVGAVAVAAAAFTGLEGGDRADGGGGGPAVTAGPSTGPVTASPSPSTRQRPDGHIGAPAVTGAPGAVADGAPPRRSASPAPSESRDHFVAPAWLPPGPGSPDLDGTADPASVYDRLRDPGACGTALDGVPEAADGDEWTLLRALSSACLAVQGEGGDWEQADRDHAALAGEVRSCKGRAAYAVLGGLLDFHRRSPGATVRLRTPAGGTPACGYRIAGVDTGGDGTARPAEVIGIELADTYFDPAELPRAATVTVGGRQVPGVPLLGPRSGDTVVLSVVVPALGPGPVDVSLRYGGDEVRLPQAFTVAPPDVVPDPAPEQDTGGGQDVQAPSAEVPAGLMSFARPGAPQGGLEQVTGATPSAPGRPTRG
ncbi:hypothetical protein [Streptomyces sp. NPDC056628]|uniref:hypothetical protein n=1 Tax=Streptomyces sp. NPDC056628 TaxID=3345882 RepID=UPI0036A578FE